MCCSNAVRLFAVAAALLALLPFTTQVHAISVLSVATMAGNGTQGSNDGPQRTAMLSEPSGIDHHQGITFIAEFGGGRYQNASRCDQGGYRCSTIGPPACMHAPGRSYAQINSCQCGCDVFFQMM